jgi:anti-anti-sigma regulatory factor
MLNIRDLKQESVVYLEGQLNKETYMKLHEHCSMIDDKEIVFDFAQVTSIDSTGIASFLVCPFCQKRDIRIINCNGQPYTLLLHLNLLKRFIKR